MKKALGLMVLHVASLVILSTKEALIQGISLLSKFLSNCSHYYLMAV